MEPLVKYKYTRKKPAATVSIFIVDDDISYLYPLVFYLQKNTHYKIYCFTSGEECMENIKLKPSLILLDYNLNPQPPNTMNGPDVLRQLRNISPKTKVVMLSSRDTQQAVIDTMKLGAYSYILKDTEAIMAIKNILSVIGPGTGNQPKTDVV
jgi:DNA-binding NarL/FixJ family response regulator